MLILKGLIDFDLEFMTKEAGDEDYYNVGIVGVRRDHTHYRERNLRGVSEVNKLKGREG
jgi:hypothetical protein